MATKHLASAELRDRIEHLSGEVQRLQRELGDTHASDYNTLKRAYVSLVQHFRALQVEAQVLKGHINALDVEVMNPDEVANELTSVAAVAAVATVAGRVLRHPRLAPLRLAIWSASALFLGWRFTHAGFSRMGSLLVRNRQRKRRLQQDWETLTERIRIMDELTRWEGQDPALQPPGASSGPSSEEGSGASGWVDVRQADQEVEGRVSYPKPYNPAVTAQDDDDGVVSYPQASASKAADEDEEGAISYPSLADAKKPAVKKGGGGGGQLRAEDLPTAPPLPAGAVPEADAKERQRVPAMRAA